VVGGNVGTVTNETPPDRGRPGPSSGSLADRLEGALRAATATGDRQCLAPLAEGLAVDEHDALVTLSALHELHLAPVDRLAGREVWQHDPTLTELRGRLESELIVRVAGRDASEDWSDLPADDAVAALRRIGRRDAVPDVYLWLARDASLDELVAFLALEGGPDGGFDDLVALCQVGLGGRAKVELARNYWDEMGRGDVSAVHTELHRQLVGALGLPVVAPAEQPVEALERGVLGSTLVLNRRFQREAVGALGLLELQAGPRCRRVLDALARLDAPPGAVPFYAEHAEADPRHGKDWLDLAVAELAEDPVWADGIVRGARWRWTCNRRFFAAMGRRFVPVGGRAPADGADGADRGAWAANERGEAALVSSGA
jgi:hypothetical protein